MYRQSFQTQSSKYNYGQCLWNNFSCFTRTLYSDGFLSSFQEEEDDDEEEEEEEEDEEEEKARWNSAVEYSKGNNARNSKTFKKSVTNAKDSKKGKIGKSRSMDMDF